MRRAPWANLLGLAGALVVVYFWTLAVLSSYREVHFPGELGGVMLSLLAALAASAIATVKGSRLWLLSLLAALVTIVIVMWKLH
jgi:hypothetical protein